MQTKLKRKQQFGEESIESKPRNAVSEPTTFTDEAKKLWNDMLKSTNQDIVGGSLGSVSEQLLGLPESGEQQLIEGQELFLETKKNQEKIQTTAEHMEYVGRDVMNVERSGETKVEMEVKRGVEEIRAEIQKLVKTSKLVERTVKDATAEKAPVKPGKYHLSFFEFVLGVIRDATRKLEDTVHFGAVFTSKKQQSKYWNSYKKHGTQFGLSGERTTATQTG
ncbi:MAG: hypothetical protein A3C30_02305 [Candidatus Levybacteria bacterium RIFCSPHIGHO2_02_FULL_40_18]|nr:MAG: hypothetical protein A2869_04685 [Candidatus Levybacteria bacterium RIFCSPHIGHO2_01_FULL_40_58]OGH26821.1 MAG: hypothetical protein A3C30_02305 [Candidatus Levybacteria bacterium RIFCSPHIGHO2_02_FULL_40_18]OGH31756.1 MAG: hypothetical protein A3E43_02025 [Candidatus Levybacteria bacterium RIFCSPHIGHO2_12_FULL_40_31]OGH40656.1 MAG: hypothetical protein A2894_00575 [Candidatus Levybacteria bacterium RIFCSPLOWO2_01_FULL_40_64]OGH48848.1 MAG: hypothetical protein A3I54_02600 [Candidatus Lev